jgi:hypothetical protein
VLRAAVKRQPTLALSVDGVLLLQVEMSQQPSTSTAGFVCKDGDLVLCARHWTAAEDGSAGDCFFVLGAGRTMQCQPEDGHGVVNFIGADAAQLKATAVAKGAQPKVRASPVAGKERTRTSGCCLCTAGIGCAVLVWVG